MACIPDQTALPVTFKSIEVGDTYFRSVYIAIHESPELSALHQRITSQLKNLCCVEPRSPCFPHMSLYYIDDSEPDERQMVADQLLSSGRVIKDGKDRITLDCFSDNHRVGHKLFGFDGGEIWVVNCQGPVEEWEVLEKVALPSTPLINH